MKTLTFTRPNRLNHLLDELLTAGIAPKNVLGRGENITIDVDDAVDSAAVAAVVNAHDAAQWDQRDRQRTALETNDRTALVDVVKTLVSTGWDSLTPQQRTAVIVAIARRLARQD